MSFENGKTSDLDAEVIKAQFREITKSFNSLRESMAAMRMNNSDSDQSEDHEMQKWRGKLCINGESEDFAAEMLLLPKVKGHGEDKHGRFQMHSHLPTAPGKSQFLFYQRYENEQRTFIAVYRRKSRKLSGTFHWRRQLGEFVLEPETKEMQDPMKEYSLKSTVTQEEEMDTTTEPATREKETGEISESVTETAGELSQKEGDTEESASTCSEHFLDDDDELDKTRANDHAETQSLNNTNVELDLAQKLAADAISAAVAQMKNEATRNEETLKEETSPVEVAETENDMAAQCQDDSRTSTKLLSLANEEDQTEQEAAVVLVETRSEKVLDTVDEEPTRLSPVPTKDASESVEVNEDNIDTEAEKMTTTPELEKPDDLEKVDKEEEKDSDTKEDKVNENKSPETIIHREEPVEVLEDTQAVQEVAALEKPEKKEGATSESDEEELSEITTSESIGTKIQELARIASQAAAENEEEQPKSDISEEKRKSETESDVLAEVTESAPEKSVIDRQEEENYERKESSSAEIQEKSTEENAAMLVEEDLNEVNEYVTDAEAQEPKEEVSQEKVPEVEPVPAEVISTNFSKETEVTAASLITPNDTLDNEKESDPSMLNVADKVTLHERSIQLVTAGMIPSRKSSIQTDIADSSTVEDVLPISTRKSRSSSSSSNGHKDENPVESTPNIVEAKEEAPMESPAEPESIEIEGEALATSPEESPLETSEKRSSSPEAAPLEPEKSAEHKTDQIAPVERVEATETIEEEKMVVEDKEDTKMSSDAESELKEPLPEKEEIEASLSPVSDETKLSVETTSSVLDNDDTQETTSTSLANIPSPIEPDSPAEIPDMSDVTSSEAPPVKEQDSSSVPDEEIPTAKVVESDTTVTSVETLPEVPKPAEEPNLEDDATGSENTVTAEKQEAATDSKEPDENLPLVKESIDVPTETHVPSSSDTESEPTVILPESKLEMEETDLASEIVKEVEERISKSEMEANNLKEVKAEEKSEADVQVAEEVLQKDVSEEVAPEEDSVVQEVVAVVVDESAAPDAPGKPLRSKKSPSSSDNEETPGALAAENETPKNKDVKDELPTPELIDDKLSDVRKKNKSRRKRDIVTCKCC